MILIDNLKKIRKLNYISEFNIELKKYKYILICDSNFIVHDSKINFLKSNIKFIFLKNIKCINFAQIVIIVLRKAQKENISKTLNKGLFLYNLKFYKQLKK